MVSLADHAPNMGFAIWKPPNEPFIDADDYQQIYTPPALCSAPASALQNPGIAAANGSKRVAWRYHATLVDNLRPAPPGGQPVSGKVVVLAVACLADNVPADALTDDTVVYAISSTGQLTRLDVDPPEGMDRDRFARTACQAVA